MFHTHKNMLIDIGTEYNSPHKFACKSYTLKNKQMMVSAVEACLSSRVSIKVACALGDVERCVFYR